MKTLTITESKAQLSALVEHVVTTREPITLGRAGKPMVQIIPYQPASAGKRLGHFEGKIKLNENFDVWDAEEAAAFGVDP